MLYSIQTTDIHEDREVKLRRDNQGIVLMGIYEFLDDTKMLDA